MNVNDFYKTTNYNELYLQLLQGIKEGVGDFNTENIALLTEKLSAVVNELNTTNTKIDTTNTKIQDLITKGVFRKTDEGGRSTNYELVL